MSRRAFEDLVRTTGYLPTWMPQTPISVGSIIALRNGILYVKGHVRDKKLAFETERSKGGTTMSFQSKKGVKVTNKLEGKAKGPLGVLGEAEAGLEVEFSSTDSALMHLLDCETEQMRDVMTRLPEFILNEQVEQELLQGVLVTEVIHARRATILSSSTRDGSAAIQVEGAVPTGLDVIGNADAKISLKASYGLENSIVDRAGIVPLFLGYGLRRFLGIGRPRMKEIFLGEDDAIESYAEMERLAEEETTKT